MVIRSASRCLVVLLALALSAACAGRTGGAINPEDGVAVRVDNNVIPPTSLTVFMVTETGARQILGSVSPSAARSFRYSPAALASSRFRLLARPTTGADLVSQPFTLVDTGAIEWSVRNNSIRFLE